MIAVIIPAGGVGKRLGAAMPKQFLPLAGKPLILWTIERFLHVPAIDHLVIPVVAGWQEQLRALLTEASLPEKIKLVPGGPTRQDSVYQGLKALPAETRLVLVHDAARPLVPISVIEAVIEATEKYGAAIAATPVKDTVKEVKDGFIQGTLPRERLYLAQTPQGARVPLLKKAFEKAYQEDFWGTDEASLLERIGAPVRLVFSSATNLKITTPEDLQLAEALLRVEAEP